MANLQIQEYGANWEEVEGFHDALGQDERDEFWDAVALEDWPAVTVALQELDAIEPHWSVRKARVLREGVPFEDDDFGYRERIWVRVDRPSSESIYQAEPLTIPGDEPEPEYSLEDY